MIYSLTFSPSLDYYLDAKTLDKNAVNRASAAFYEVGGKGINVSRVLSTLGVKSTAIMFTGGFVGSEIRRRLREYDLDIINIETLTNSRINIKLPEYEINAPAPDLTESDMERLAAVLKEITPSDTLIISGKIPENINIKTLFAGLGETRLIFDVSGDIITDVLTLSPFLIKPNHLEICEYYGVKPTTDNDVLTSLARKMIASGARNVLLSLGENGLMLINENTTLFEEPYHGKAVNAVAAGDSCLAGFVAGLNKIKIDEIDDKFSESLKLANASGAAAAFSEGLQKLKEIEKLLNR
jgi:1-phosphofructokinase